MPPVGAAEAIEYVSYCRYNVSPPLLTGTGSPKRILLPSGGHRTHLASGGVQEPYCTRGREGPMHTHR